MNYLKISLITIYLLFSTLIGYSQEDTIFKQQRKPVLSAIAELGFLNVFDHKVQFGRTGTYFDYKKEGGQNVLFPVSRLSLELQSNRNTIYFLYQPLRLTTQVYLENDLVVDEAVFPAQSSVKLLYNFPFYRFSYTREFFPNHNKLDFSFGGSIQIRNATITFESADGSTFRANRDVGIVPALKVKSTYHFSESVYSEIEADGIYAPISYLNGSDNEVVGAILDASLRTGLKVYENVDTYLNLRYLGGGAVGASDKKEGPGDGYVRNWLHFGTLTAGFRYIFE